MAKKARNKDTTTVERIMDCAEFLVQTRGYNGFSYGDISKECGITKASIHHHFATKEGLGRALILRYHQRFFSALHAIEASQGSASGKLDAYVSLYFNVLRDKDRMCLCGMLAADFYTLPQSLRKELKAFFEANETWLAALLAAGAKEGEFKLQSYPRDEARVFSSALEGAMLVTRCFGDTGRFKAAAACLLSGLRSPRAARSR